MRKDLSIASIILLIIGFAIGGPIGNIILSVAILLVLYVFFSKDQSRERPISTGYIDYGKKKTDRFDRDKKQNIYRTRPYGKGKRREFDKTNQYDVEKAGHRKSSGRMERELTAWGSDKQAKRCPQCGSTSHPANARFCADCGAKL